MSGRNQHREPGGASVLVLGIVLGAGMLILVLAAIGGSYVAHAELQQAADIAAASLATGGSDAPIDRAERYARDNGARRVHIVASRDATYHVVVERGIGAPLGIGPRMQLRAEAWADIAPASDGGPNPPGIYAGALETVDGVRVCPRVATAYRAMDHAAQRDGVSLTPTSGFRTWAEQAALFARLGPHLAAPPGTSRHHDATELDIAVGPAGSPTHRWLQRHGPSFGFIPRYSWEPWHWGYVAGC
jgi:hypothetical protein